MGKQPAQRYVQPKNVREAMTVIQDLFNQYRHAPLTTELLNYHDGLIQRLQSDIFVAALRENNPAQQKQLGTMIQAMKTWRQIRVSGQPFNGKMKNFKLVTNNGPHFKQHVHKIKGNHNYRGVRH